MADQLGFDPYIVRKMANAERDFFLGSHGAYAFLYPFFILFPPAYFQKEYIFHKVPAQKRQEVEDQDRQRHIFVVYIQIVARRELYLERIILGTAGAASDVEDLGGRAEHISVTVDPGAVSDVDVFQICEMSLVKVSDLSKSAAAVDRSACACREYLICFRVICDRASCAPADPPADHRIEITGAVDQFRVVHLDHFAAYGEDPGRSFDGIEQFFYKMRISRSIIIKKDHIGGAGTADPDIYCFAESIILVKGDDLDLWIMFLHIFDASVCGGIVDDKDLKIFTGLFFKRSKTRFHKVFPVIIRNYDCYFHIDYP